MENISEFEITTSYGEVIKYILIDKGNEEFVSMPKSLWDEQQAQQQKLLGEIHE